MRGGKNSYSHYIHKEQKIVSNYCTDILKCSNYKLQINFICKEKQEWRHQKCLANNERESTQIPQQKIRRTQRIFTIIQPNDRMKMRSTSCYTYLYIFTHRKSGLQQAIISNINWLILMNIAESFSPSSHSPLLQIQ